MNGGHREYLIAQLQASSTPDEFADALEAYGQYEISRCATRADADRFITQLIDAVLEATLPTIRKRFDADLAALLDEGPQP